MPKKLAQEPKQKAQASKEPGLQRRKSAGDTLIYSDTPSRVGMFVRGVRSEIPFYLPEENTDDFWAKYKGLILFHVCVGFAEYQAEILQGLNLVPDNYISGDIVAAGQVVRCVKYDEATWEARSKFHGIYRSLEEYADLEEVELGVFSFWRLEITNVGLLPEPVMDVGAEDANVLWVPEDEGHLACVKLASDRVKDAIFPDPAENKQIQDYTWELEATLY